MSRSEKSLKNLVTALIGQSIGLIISFVARIVFIKFLGAKYLGVNGLFTNILSVLSLAELGVGEAITFSLYKPLALNDTYKCNMLMQLYKKVYIFIGFFIFIVGISITPFLKLFISENSNINNLEIIYILFVLNSALSYFFSYKRNLIIADQNRYIATIYRYAFYLILNICQIIYLVLVKDYIGFLVLQIINTILENIFVSIKANKMYPYLQNNDKIPLDNESKSQIIKNTKAMMMHKIGGTIVNSTDNIILSKFVSIVSVGVYSNYYLIISALNTIYNQIFSSLTASVGNLYITESREKTYNIFKNIYFLNFVVYSISAVCLLTLINKFITIWLGDEYIFSFSIILILVVNFYITGMRKSVLTFKEAVGLFYNDRWKSVIEGIINLIASIILVKICGIFGVFFGTFISSISTCVWIEPYILYKDGFDKSVSLYFKKYFQYIFFTVLLGIICCLIDFKICIGNLFINLLVTAIVNLSICLIFILCIYCKSEELKFFRDKIFSILKGLRGKKC